MMMRIITVPCFIAQEFLSEGFPTALPQHSSSRSGTGRSGVMVEIACL